MNFQLRASALTNAAAALALAGCASVNPGGSMYASEALYAVPASERGTERGDYGALTVAFLPSDRTWEGMRERPSAFKGGNFYQPEIWLTNLQSAMGNHFKGLIKVKNSAAARSVGADLIAVVDCVGSLTSMTNQLTLELGAVFSTPDGIEVASVRAKNLKKGSMFYTNPGASAQDAVHRFTQELLFSRKLAAFARGYRKTSGPPEVAAAPRSLTQELLYSRKLAALARENRKAYGPPEVAAETPSLAPEELVSDVDRPGFALAPRADDYAVVIGVSQYSSLPEARYAERDAEAVTKHLVALGLPERNIVHLSGGKATRSMIQGYLEEWLPKNVKPESRVFFYFSGHGAPDPKTGEAFLVPWDGSASFLQSTAYPLKQLYRSLGGLKAKSVIIALDSCFSGAGGRSVLADGARPLVMRFEEAALPRQNMTLFTAASGDEITATLPGKSHGAFTYFFLQGLAGAAKDASGKVTVKGLYDYLKPNVQDEAHRQNREQTPLLQGACPDCELARF